MNRLAPRGASGLKLQKIIELIEQMESGSARS